MNLGSNVGNQASHEYGAQHSNTEAQREVGSQTL